MAKEEISKLFKKKKAKKSGPTWTHKFSCLALVGQDRVPTTEMEKDELLEAGLGEKDILFEDLSMSAEEFRDVILQNFPRLTYGGGFQFFKCLPNTRRLDALSPTAMSSPGMLKSRVGSSRTYIKPLQKDLDLSPTCDLPCGVSSVVSV